jgi:excisionase family DNA binding protein
MGELLDKGEQRTTEALLSAENVAEYFGVKTTTVYRWCKEGRIPCLKIGKHWRMRRGQLVDFLEAEEPEEG